MHLYVSWHYALVNFTFTIAISCLAVVLEGCSTDSQRATVTLPPDPQIETLIAHVNDDWDELHPENTPAVWELIGIGERALPYVLPLVESDNELTRERAIVVLSVVSSRMMGFVPFGDLKTIADREKQASEEKRFWHSLGDLHADASLASRRHSIKLWTEWLESRQTSPESKATTH